MQETTIRTLPGVCVCVCVCVCVGMVGAFAALAEDWSSVPSTHIRWLTPAYNSGSRGFYVLFCPLWAHAHTGHTYIFKSNIAGLARRHSGKGACWVRLVPSAISRPYVGQMYVLVPTGAGMEVHCV